jgi:conjugative relaxase-like TrwC/TraI family protein
MLRISEQTSSWTICRYYASDRYYDQGLGIVGAWGGLGAQRLGLRGTVTRRALERLCDNGHPSTGKQLTVRVQKNRTVAYTFRFSLCKSVSLLYGLYQDASILDAFRAAVTGTMLEMESEMKTRVRKPGQQGERVTGNMVWAEFLHTTASPVRGQCDPQLHAYLCVFNATWDEVEGCWKAGWFQDLKRDAPYFEAMFRAHAARLIGSLGYKIERDGKDFEIAGVPSKVLKGFSRRTEVVEQKALELGVTDPDWKRMLGPRTREGGLSAFWTPDYLRREWTSRLLPEEAQALADIYHRRTTPSENPDRAREIVDETLQDNAGRGAVTERRLLTAMLVAGMGEVTVEAVRRELAQRPASRIGVGRELALLL